VTRAEAWRRADPDAETAAELGDLIARGAEEELGDRFAGRLEFGTAGLRGTLGAGPNRMNRAVVRQTSAGLARYLLREAPDVGRRGVVVGRDARHMSREFAEETAGVLVALGIPAHVFPEAVPTPLAAYASLELGAAGAVVVTASHNPPEYNGYKVYWGNGAQISEPHDQNIAAEIARGPEASEIELRDPRAARQLGLWHDIGPEIGQSYLGKILGLRRHPGAGTDLEIVYTALHGVGGEWTTRALAGAGFRNLTVVAEQHEPDPRFPTVRFPNPEEPGALDLARALAEERAADLLLANDPDADRLAVGVRARDGGLRILSGDEVGILLGHYVLTQTRPLPPRPLVMTTIVSSAQLGRIARDLGARYEETLTGFRWLCNRAMTLEREQQASFLFAYEEALGYVVGPAVRDKDGVGAALVFADLAGWCRSQGLTVLDYLEQIQRRHGLSLSAQRSFRFSGPAGAATIARVMQGFRERPPERVAGLEVVLVRDYQERVARGRDTERRLELPAANVMGFELAGGSRVTVRPSGTEPKVKYYFELGERAGDAESLAAASARGDRRLQELITGFLALAAERGQPS